MHERAAMSIATIRIRIRPNINNPLFGTALSLTLDRLAPGDLWDRPEDARQPDFYNYSA